MDRGIVGKLYSAQIVSLSKCLQWKSICEFAKSKSRKNLTVIYTKILGGTMFRLAIALMISILSVQSTFADQCAYNDRVTAQAARTILARAQFINELSPR